jgi:hypothetical protein
VIRIPYDVLDMDRIRQLLDRLLAGARAIGVPERVVYALPVIPPLIPLAKVVQWPDQALQRLVLKAYLKDLAGHDRGGDEFPEDAGDRQQPNTGEPT